MSFFHRFLTEFEQEMLKEMDKPEKWIANDYTIDHVAGFRYWVTNMPLIDFGSVKPISKVPTPKFSGFIAKFLLWAKYQFVLNPALTKIECALAYQALKNDNDDAMAALKSEDKNNA
jgi:hypothetical protein